MNSCNIILLCKIRKAKKSVDESYLLKRTDKVEQVWNIIGADLFRHKTKADTGNFIFKGSLWSLYNSSPTSGGEFKILMSLWLPPALQCQDSLPNSSWKSTSGWRQTLSHIAKDNGMIKIRCAKITKLPRERNDWLSVYIKE